MVALPSIKNDVPQLKAPTSPVSASDISQPYNQIAQNLDQAGDILMKDVAQPLAKRAGIQAVTRDAEGGLQVERLPIVGPAAVDFENAVQWSALAQSSGEARRMDLELARQRQNDPQSYLKAADEFKKSYVDKITKSVGPEVGTRLGQIIDSTTTQQYSSLLAQHQAMIKRNFDRDTAAVIKDATVDLYNLIETGGLDTPVGARQAHEFVERIRGTINARVNNPVLGAPPEEAALAMKKLDQDIGGAMFGARVKKVLDDNPDDGVSKAEDLIDRNFNDTSIPASQRVANRDRAQDAIKTFTQDRVRAASVAAKQQKAYDDEFENRVIASTTPGGPVMTETDIKKDPLASASAKIKALAFVKREGMPEPLARVSHETSMDLLRRIRSGEMAGNGEIYDAYDAGKLNRSDFKFVKDELEALRTPAGERLNKAKEVFFRSVKSQIDHSNPLMGKIDQDGPQQLYRLEWDVNQRMDEYRKAGKNPYDLLDPSKPDYMGSAAAIEPYTKSMAESARDIARRFQPRAAPPPAAGAPAPAQPAAPSPTARRPGETPDDYLKRMGIR